MDVTTFFGYKSRFMQSLENNGLNPVSVTSITLIQETTLRNKGIYHEIENNIPLTIAGNDDIDVFSDFYSICDTSEYYDLTYSITCDVIDMTDLTTVIDTTYLDMTLDLTNGALEDPEYYNLLHKLNKYFAIGPNAPTDTTLNAVTFTATGYPLIEFDKKIRYQLFTSKYSPQFVIFNNSSTGTTVITGEFNYNISNNSLEAYFTAEEKGSILGMAFNNIYMFYSDGVLN